jgi:hypothetical protein
MKQFLVFFFILIFFPQVVKSQHLATFSVKKVKVNKLLKKIETKFNITFSYRDDIIKNKKITLNIKQQNLNQILNKVSAKTKLIFNKIDDRYYSISEQILISKKTQILPPIIITNYLTKGIEKNLNTSFNVFPNKLGVLAGLTEADVFETLHQLPSVVNPNETATQIIVRGGNSDQNNILFDNIPIYHKGHLYGMISPINPNIVNKITFYTKATNPRYNEKASSVIAINTNETINDKPVLNFGVNGINFDVNTSVPIIKNKLQIETSIRRSISELFETPTFKRYEEKVYQTTRINNSKEKEFYFTDYSFKLNFIPNVKNQFFFTTLFIDNNLDYSIDESQNNSLNDLLKIKNFGASFKWNRKWNSKLNQTTIVSYSDYNSKFNRFKFNNTVLASSFKKGNQVYDANFTHFFKFKKDSNTDFELGYQLNFKNVSYAFIKKENNNTFLLDTENKNNTKHQLFGNISFKKNNFHFNIGGNLNYYSELNKFKISPRILISKQLSKYFKIEFTTEFKNQNIHQIDETVLSDLTLDNKIWRLSNGNKTPIIDSKHYSFGGVFNKNKWTIDLDFYYKTLNGITALSLGYLNPENPNFNIGKQKNTGIELYIKKDFKPFNVWINYSLLNLKNKFENINKNNYFTAIQEIKHNGSISFSYKKNKLETAIAWFIHSGKPFTDYFLDTNNKLVFSRINTKRHPAYHRLDFTSTYKFYISKKRNVNGKIGISIRNLYNHKNWISREYLVSNTPNQSIDIHNVYGIKLTPNFLVRVWF